MNREHRKVAEDMSMKEDLLELPISTYVEIITLIESAKRQADELEAVNAAYNDAQKEISTLKKRNERLTKRSNQMGKDLLWAKNKLRENGDERWKLLNKKVRHAQSKF